MNLLIMYIIIFILQIALFAVCIRKKKKKLWMILFSAECIPMIVALGLGIYYNIYGGPNFAGFFVVLFSFVATFVYGLFLAISIIVAEKYKGV